FEHFGMRVVAHDAGELDQDGSLSGGGTAKDAVNLLQIADIKCTQSILAVSVAKEVKCGYSHKGDHLLRSAARGCKHGLRELGMGRNIGAWERSGERKTGFGEFRIPVIFRASGGGKTEVGNSSIREWRSALSRRSARWSRPAPRWGSANSWM